jgi:signal transduction histidine kinase
MAKPCTAEPTTAADPLAAVSREVASETAQACEGQLPEQQLPLPHEIDQPSTHWKERLDAWQKSANRFHEGTRSTMDIIAYAQRLSSAANFALEAARGRSLELLVDTQEHELLRAQGAEALERAALRRDEAMLAGLAEELSTLETSIRGEQPTSTSQREFIDVHASADAGQQLLEQLASREDMLLQQRRQENVALREALVEMRDRMVYSEREASLLCDAREATRALLVADSGRFNEQVDSLRKALASVQNDIAALRAGGREVTNRSVEVADELSAAEAELQADQAAKGFARQHANIAAQATKEQLDICRLFGSRDPAIE